MSRPGGHIDIADIANVITPAHRVARLPEATVGQVMEIEAPPDGIVTVRDDKGFECVLKFGQYARFTTHDTWRGAWRWRVDVFPERLASGRPPSFALPPEETFVQRLRRKVADTWG